MVGKNHMLIRTRPIHLVHCHHAHAYVCMHLLECNHFYLPYVLLSFVHVCLPSKLPATYQIISTTELKMPFPLV